MNNNLVNIQYFDNEDVQYDRPILKDQDKILNEINVYIDSNHFSTNNNIYKIQFRKVGISTIFVREVIIKYTDEFINYINDNKFLVLRFKQLNDTNNNIIYNTSKLNPDTDLILNKSHIIEPFYNFDAKYMMHIQNKNKIFTSLEFEILNHNCEKIPFKIEFFMDIKLNIITT